MGIDQCKEAIDNLDKKYFESFRKFAQGGFIDEIAACLKILPADDIHAIVATYPEPIKEQVNQKLQHFRNSYFDERIENFILSQEDLFNAEDYLELQNEIKNLSIEEYDQLLVLCTEKNNEWLKNKIEALRPCLYYLEKFQPYEIRTILSVLTSKDFFAIFEFAPEDVKQMVKRNISKNNMTDLEKDFQFLKKPAQEDYTAVLQKINNKIADEGYSLYERWE